MRNQRGQFRIAVERQGVVTPGTKTAPCIVRNLTEEGLLIETDLQIAEGDRIQIECQLGEQSSIHCVLLVASATLPLFGRTYRSDLARASATTDEFHEPAHHRQSR